MLSEANHLIKSRLLKTQLLKNISPMILSSFGSLTKIVIVAKKDQHNDRMYAPEAIKKKDVAAKCLCARIVFSHSFTVSDGA